MKQPLSASERVMVYQRAARRVAQDYPNVYERYLIEERAKIGLGPPRHVTAKHGTRSGYEKHRRDGEEPCSSCRAAHNVYQAQYQKGRRR